MLALVIFAGAMVVLSHLVHDTSANTRHQVIASQVTQQLDPLLVELRTAQNQQKNLETRYLLALVRRSFNIYSDSLNAKFGLYDGKSGEAIMIMRGLPASLPPSPPFFYPCFLEMIQNTRPKFELIANQVMCYYTNQNLVTAVRFRPRLIY